MLQNPARRAAATFGQRPVRTGGGQEQRPLVFGWSRNPLRRRRAIRATPRRGVTEELAWLR